LIAWEDFVSEMTYYVSSGTLNLAKLKLKLEVYCILYEKQSLTAVSE